MSRRRCTTHLVLGTLVGRNIKILIRPHKKKVVSRPLPPHFWVPHHFFFFYKNADNVLEIEIKRSKIEMPLSFLKDFYT